jgi:hypothetical protein
MSESAKPIRQRFAWLHDQWIAFAENERARVLVWRVQDDERRMLDAFLSKESDPEIGELPDLFLRLSAPFMNADAYVLALRAALIAAADAQAAEAPDGAADQLSRWLPPALSRSGNVQEMCLASYASFHAHYQLPGLLALVLEPSAVSDPAAFTSWLASASGAAAPQVRFVVIDSARAPALLLSAGGAVVVQEAALDMPSALLQISRAAGGLDTPGGMFRHLFVAFTAALGKQDLTRAEQLGARLLLITTAQGWFALEVPVHLALGASLAEQKRTNDALARYVAAERSAFLGEQAGDAACAKLRMQARMVRGGLLISNQSYPEAATLFIETLPMALALADARTVIDCHRLASFSREQEGKIRPAWQHGLDALDFAHTVDGDTLRSSTLKFLGEGMQRLAKHETYRSQGARIQRDFDQLLAEPKPGAQAAKA